MNLLNAMSRIELIWVAIIINIMSNISTLGTLSPVQALFVCLFIVNIDVDGSYKRMFCVSIFHVPGRDLLSAHEVGTWH